MMTMTYMLNGTDPMPRFGIGNPQPRPSSLSCNPILLSTTFRNRLWPESRGQPIESTVSIPSITWCRVLPFLCYRMYYLSSALLWKVTIFFLFSFFRLKCANYCFPKYLGYSSVSSVLNAKKKAKAPAPSSHEIQHYSQDLLVSSLNLFSFIYLILFHVLILKQIFVSLSLLDKRCS